LKKKIQLFDDNDVLNIEEHFNEKQIPKKRKKLKDLQASLITTNDPRFQISEQFLDEPNEEISIEEEKKKSLEILDQITNAKSSVSKPKTKMIRFDPSKTEHKIYEIESEIKTNEDSEEIKTKSKGTTPVIDSTRTYDFDESKLKSMFDKTSNSNNTSNQNGQFQFQFFNNKEPINLPVPKIFPAPKPISNGKSKIFLNKPDDTSSDEDGNNEQPSLSEEVEIKNDTFFFFDIDNRLKGGLESFVRTEDLNELERTWPTKRKEIGEALRTKHRKAIQRKDKYRVFNQRRRQKQYSSSNPISKSDID